MNADNEAFWRWQRIFHDALDATVGSRAFQSRTDSMISASFTRRKNHQLSHRCRNHMRLILPVGTKAVSAIPEHPRTPVCPSKDYRNVSGNKTSYWKYPPVDTIIFL